MNLRNMHTSLGQKVLTVMMGIFVIGFMLMFIVDTQVTNIPKAESSASDNVSGFAWSENIGWISMNSVSDGSATNYGVTVAQNGALSGYAWSEHIGWISFNAGEVAGCPSGGSAPVLDRGTGVVSGWARALSAPAAGANAGGWDGCISLSGTGYAVTVDASCNWGGWAWGSDVVGWVNFSGNGGNVVGTGFSCLTPDIVSGGVVVPTPVRIGTGINLSIPVLNVSPIAATADFTDTLEYQWGGTGGTWNNFANNSRVHVGGLAGNTSTTDSPDYNIPATIIDQVGDLYLRHCVDTTNAIDEGQHEGTAENCSISNRIQVISGDITSVPASPIAIKGEGTATLSWNTQNTGGLTCTVSGVDINGRNTGSWTGANNAGVTTMELLADTTYTLTCGGVLVDSVVVLVDVTPEIFVDKPIVNVNDNVTVRWDLNRQTDCTLTSGSNSYDPYAGTSMTLPIFGRTTFTVTCPLPLPEGKDSVSVEVVAKGFET